MNKLKINFILILLLGIILHPQATNASYEDLENSQLNQLTAKSLDFTVRDNATGAVSDPTSPLFFATEMLPGDTIVVPLDITKEGSANFKYQIQKEYLIPSTNLCDGLTMEAKLEGTTIYSGALNTFVLPSAITHSGTTDHWVLTLGLPTDNADYRSKACMFGINFKAWQTDSDGTWGFTSEKKYSLNVIESANWPIPGDLVINELMWMGSTVSTADEWTELRNTTSNELNISGLILDNAGVGNDDLIIPAGSYIDANGFYLISNYSAANLNSALSVTSDWITTDVSLDNGGEQIAIINQKGTTLDQTPSGGWAAGLNGATNNSMERGAVPGDGTIASNWHSCLDSGCNDTVFWDFEGNDYGTPKAVNLSENDLTIHPNYGQISLINQIMSFLVEDQPLVIPTPFFSITITPTPSPTTFPTITITPTPEPQLITDPQPILTTSFDMASLTPSITPELTITPITPTTFPTVGLTITPTIAPEIIEIPSVVPTEIPTLAFQPEADPPRVETPTPTMVIEEFAAVITTEVTTVTPTPTIEVTPEPTIEITPTPEPTVEITPTPEVVE